MSNQVFIKHNRNWGLDEKKVFYLVRQVLQEYKMEKVELSLLFCGRQKAKRLNMEYRKMDYIPQVLSFPLKAGVDSDGLRRLGDIVICNEKLKYEADFLGKDIYLVLVDWLRHGMKALAD